MSISNVFEAPRDNMSKRAEKLEVEDLLLL